jgi:hypothetical protein
MQKIARRHLIGIGATLAVAPPLLGAAPAFAATGPLLAVWKNRGCTCCTAWARLLDEAGFVVAIHEVDDLGPARQAAGVPDDLVSCHTARVAGYTVEGHVPVEAVQRLLDLHPDVVGLAVPGMPVGAPGMAVAGMAADRFDVIAFAVDGRRSVFA